MGRVRPSTSLLVLESYPGICLLGISVRGTEDVLYGSMVGAAVRAHSAHVTFLGSTM